MTSTRPDIEVHLTIVGALHTAFGVLALLGLLAAAFVGIGLGVAMGAYSLWVLLQDDARRALGGERW